MKIAFTICSNNYLARAKVTAESFLKHHADYDFKIFLVDEFSEAIDYSVFTVPLIKVSSFFCEMEKLSLRYDIMELNASVKPIVFQEILKENKYSTLIFIDPDTCVYDRFDEIEDLLVNCNVIITPHFCSPIDDGKFASEIDLFPFGLFNLGFLALKDSTESKAFLDWWHNRLMKYCYDDLARYMFCDQPWVSYGPVLFEGFHILKHRGYNVANWNLFEREFSKDNDMVFINKKEKLKFFHFSHYVFSEPYRISKNQRRHKIEDLPTLKLLIDDYQQQLIANNHEFVSGVISSYQLNYEKHKRKRELAEKILAKARK